ncbi:MAG: Glycerophosphoryl diester phosphodiesterase [Ktedonobacterales bacterium]|jgi:glycerophosphoryl diester phosphodiesterase|nr:MAG: Glycerophosphoryl diester phosphodiesterase [Ktedonobacterales bacterium]
MATQRNEQPRVICYAHRGARAAAPENTLHAFAVAFDLGADAIECDVQRSRDGRLVIIHDGTVDRTTDGTGPVAEQSFAELRALNAGARWRQPQRIPTLDETLALVRERGGALNLEIKGESVAESVGTAEAVAPVLAALDPAFLARILVSSFEHPALALLKQRLPGLRIAALYGTDWKGRNLIAPALALRAEAIHPGVNLSTHELVRRAHDAGLRANVWTANRWATIRKLLTWQVDGLFSDYPERVIQARAALATTADQTAPEKIGKGGR